MLLNEKIMLWWITEKILQFKFKCWIEKWNLNKRSIERSRIFLHKKTINLKFSELNSS
jgi:hypothetical protein